MQVTVIGPNLPSRLANRGSMHVHKAGCRDIAIEHYPMENADTMEAANVAEIVESIYPASDFCYDPENPAEYAPYRDDIYVAPCVTIPAWRA